MRLLVDLAWRDLRSSGRSLWIFCACLMLGVALVAAGGGLYRQVADGLRADARLLFGGDVEIEQGEPLPASVLEWMQARAVVSRVVELRTMMRLDDGRAQLVELQSADGSYPLYGEVTLSPGGSLGPVLAESEGAWGVAIDAAMARRLGVAAGDAVEIGDARFVVRALVTRQPDRSLRAEWAGAPVLVSEGGLQASGLVQPGSRVEYVYRVRTDEAAVSWRDAFVAAFPALDAEVRTFEQRSERMADVLGQIGSGLLLLGFSALFIGGLGVSNSVQAYLQGKLAAFATLRAMGMRDRRVAMLALLQVLMLASAASAVGVVLGNLLALAGTALAAQRLPLGVALPRLLAPSVLAFVFGLLTALMFALPALGRALSVPPAALFRGVAGDASRTPRGAWLATAGTACLLMLLLVGVLPDPRFGLAFVGATLVVLLLLEGLTRALRRGAASLQARRWPPLPLELRLALSAMQRPSSPLHPALLSLGSALTLLVACTLVVTVLLRTIDETVPLNAPALVMHDVQREQIEAVRDMLGRSPGLQRVDFAPLVLGRLSEVNGSALRDSDDGERVREARDEHKLSDRAGNIDDVVVVRGAWWPADHAGPALVAMEDREADQLGLQVGDRLRFMIQGNAVDVQLAAIYAQRRLQARLWLEGIFSDGVLDPYINRHVGAAWMPADEALAAQDRLARTMPNIVTVRTQAMLGEVRALMARATGGLVVVALASLACSLLVLASVVAASRARHVYDATVMHALGARLSSLRRVLWWEYGLLALATAGFGIAAGSLLATLLLRARLDLDPGGLYWSGALVALFTSAASLGMGAIYLQRRMRMSPAALLREVG